MRIGPSFEYLYHHLVPPDAGGNAAAGAADSSDSGAVGDVEEDDGTSVGSGSSSSLYPPFVVLGIRIIGSTPWIVEGGVPETGPGIAAGPMTVEFGIAFVPYLHPASRVCSS